MADDDRVLTPEGDELFSFDGAEGVAFWVYDPAKLETARVMLDDLPRLRAFLDHWFPEREPEHDERRDDFSDMTWERLISTFNVTVEPIEKGWVTFRGGPRHAVRDGRGYVWFELWTSAGNKAAARVRATFEADRA